MWATTQTENASKNATNNATKNEKRVNDLQNKEEKIALDRTETRTQNVLFMVWLKKSVWYIFFVLRKMGNEKWEMRNDDSEGRNALNEESEMEHKVDCSKWLSKSSAKVPTPSPFETGNLGI